MPVSGTSKFTKSLKGSATTPLIIDDDNPVNTFAAKLCSLGVHVHLDVVIMELGSTNTYKKVNSDCMSVINRHLDYNYVEEWN